MSTIDRNSLQNLFKRDKSRADPKAFQGTSAATTPDNQDYVLAGLVEGSCALFEVKVPKEESVHQLKKSVWDEALKNTELHNINISLLVKVNIAITDAHDDKSLTQLKSEVNVEGKRLMPLKSVAHYWPVHPPRGYLHMLVKAPVPAASNVDNFEEPHYTSQWIALKNSSRFVSSADPESQQHEVRAGCLLCLDNLSPMLSMSDTGSVSSVFIRECYLIWFQSFLLAVERWPCGKFALSSTPGCGKTFATNLIFRMAASENLLQGKPILYQFGTDFHHFHEDKVFNITRQIAGVIAVQPETFYIVNGRDANPVTSDCLTLFIASPSNIYFKDWHYHAQTTPLYFPTWSIEELLRCRELCYQMIEETTVAARFRRYGGVARYVFWQHGEPPSLDDIVMDSDARKGIQQVGEPSRLFPTSHMLLHIATDDQMHFKHVVLASRHVGLLLFSKFFQETMENLKSLLVGWGSLAGNLFECYVHFLFEYGHGDTLRCRSLEGDGVEFTLKLKPRNVVVFDSVPAKLSDDNYYMPLSPAFPAVDAMTKQVALQYTVSGTRPIKSVQDIETISRLYPGNTLPLLFVVPESIPSQFHKQQILTTEGKIPAGLPSIQQFVAGLPFGIDTSPIRLEH